MAKQLLTPPNLALLKEGEEQLEKQQKQFFDYRTGRVKYLIEELKPLSKKYWENPEDEANKEYFAKIDKLIDLCQGGFLGFGLSLNDQTWVMQVLNFLLSLYDPLITRIVHVFVGKMNGEGWTLLDIEVKSYAQSLFMRLITGDTPWAIESLMSQEKPTEETKATLADINVHKHRQHTRKWFDEKIVALKINNANPEDIKIAQSLFDMDFKDFSNWINQHELNFDDWLVSQASYVYKVRKQQLDFGLITTPEALARIKLQITYIKILLEDGDFYVRFVTDNQEQLQRLHKQYVKESYSDERYDKTKKVNFTWYIEQYLPRRLMDLYKRKELRKRFEVSVEENEDYLENETTPNPDEQVFDEMFTSSLLQKMQTILTPIEIQVLLMRLADEDITDTEIAKKLHLSKPRISQIRRKIKEKALELGLK